MNFKLKDGSNYTVLDWSNITLDANDGLGGSIEITTDDIRPIKEWKNINWEQRRYEIARDLYVKYRDTTAEDAVRQADNLIEELKKM